jgi:RNA polymerase sigma factor (sigma-70 family)
MVGRLAVAKVERALGAVAAPVCVMSPGIPTRLLATQSDERLLALVRDGHERAFEAIVKRYRRPLLGYCRRLSLSDARAEDTVQLALLKTWIAVREGAEVRDLKAWLYRVAHNTAVNALRDCAHDGEPLAEPELHARAADAEESPLERRLRMREALAEVAALPPLQREVIVRTAMAGHSHQRVATDLGITNGAVRGLLYRARTTLRTAITALTPLPLLGWLAGRPVQRAPSPERLTELAAGAGTAGAAASAGGGAGVGGLLLKGGAALIAAGTVATGAAIVHLGAEAHHRAHPPKTLAQAPPGGHNAGALTSDVGAERYGASMAGIDAGGAPVHSAARRRDGSGAGAHGGRRPPGAEGERTNVGDGRGDGAAPRSGGGANGDAHLHTVSPSARQPSPSTGTPAQPGGVGSGGGGSGQGSGATGSGAGSGGGSGSGSGAQPGSASGNGTPGGSAGGGASGGGASGAGSSGGGTSGTSGAGSGAGSGSGGGSGSGSGGGSGSGSGAGSNSGTGSGGAEGAGQGTTGGSESSGGEHSGSLVGAVVHEVGSIVEHLLH